MWIATECRGRDGIGVKVLFLNDRGSERLSLLLRVLVPTEGNGYISRNVL